MLTSDFPSITPLLNVNPVGREGVMDQSTTSPPLFTTVRVEMPTSRVYVWSATAPRLGTTSFTVMLTVVVSLPPELVAVTV